MEENYEIEPRSNRTGIVLAIVAIVAACVIAVAVAVTVVMPQARLQGTASLKSAILQSANQCYAIEGAYPYNLAYLEDNYGLVVNHNDYNVVYEVFADNVAPNVVVVAK